MSKKKVVIALGHRALGTTMPEQYKATRNTAKAIADLVEAGADVVISHSNAPQVGMIHTAMNEFSKDREDYTQAPMSVCSAMSQGYVGYDLQNAIRAELLKRGVYRPVCTIITQVMVDPYDDAFNEPVKVIGRLLSKEEAEQEEKHGNYVTEVEGGYRRIVAAPKPQGIIEIDSIKALSDQGQVVIAWWRNSSVSTGSRTSWCQRSYRERLCQWKNGRTVERRRIHGFNKCRECLCWLQYRTGISIRAYYCSRSTEIHR